MTSFFLYSGHSYRQPPPYMGTGPGPSCTNPVKKVFNERAAYLKCLKTCWFHGNHCRPVSLYIFSFHVVTVSGSTGASSRTRVSVSRLGRCPWIMCKPRHDTRCVTILACVFRGFVR